MKRRQILAFALAFMLCACSENSADKATGVQPVYDDNTAFVLAAQEIPAGNLDYYLFDFDPGHHIDPSEAIKNNVEEIREGLQDNPLGSAYMAVIGPDAQHNLEVIRTLMRAHNKATYPDLTFIYLGPVGNQKTVRELLQPLQADVRYVVYP